MLSCFDKQNLFKMMYIFHILINSADTDEMPLFGSSLFAKVPVYYCCLPAPRQLKFTKVLLLYFAHKMFKQG